MVMGFTWFHTHTVSLSFTFAEDVEVCGRQLEGLGWKPGGGKVPGIDRTGKMCWSLECWFKVGMRWIMIKMDFKSISGEV